MVVMGNGGNLQIIGWDDDGNIGLMIRGNIGCGIRGNIGCWIRGTGDAMNRVCTLI